MYFVYRDGIYHDVAGKSFRDFMAGKLGDLRRASIWVLGRPYDDKFPEVRLKKYIEMRGTDGGPWKNFVLCQHLGWLLYDSDAQRATWDFVKRDRC